MRQGASGDASQQWIDSSAGQLHSGFWTVDYKPHSPATTRPGGRRSYASTAPTFPYRISLDSDKLHGNLKGSILSNIQERRARPWLSTGTIGAIFVFAAACSERNSDWIPDSNEIGFDQGIPNSEKLNSALLECTRLSPHLPDRINKFTRVNEAVLERKLNELNHMLPPSGEMVPVNLRQVGKYKGYEVGYDVGVNLEMSKPTIYIISGNAVCFFNPDSGSTVRILAIYQAANTFERVTYDSKARSLTTSAEF